MENTMKNKCRRGYRRWHRHGIIDVQFNWIFILVAGFIIFLFIISIVYSQKRNADRQENIKLSKQILTLINSRQQSNDAYTEISMPQGSVKFRCDADQNYSTMQFNDGDPLRMSAITFSPKTLAGTKLLVWTKPLDIGFPVSILTFITAKNKAIIVYDSSSSSKYAKQFFDDLPSNITKSYISSEADLGKFSDKVVVCFEGDCPPSYDVIIEPLENNDLYGYGNVHFKDGSSQPYIGTTLFGAVFSNDAGMYQCQMQRLTTQYIVKLSLLDARLKLINTDLPAGLCQDTINTILASEIKNMYGSLAIETDVASIYAASIDLNSRNLALTLGSCPKMY
jgi:hypothetical protein